MTSPRDILQDFGHIVGDRSDATKRTTMNHMSKYLKYLNSNHGNGLHPYLLYDKNIIPISYWTHDVVGKFPSYLMEVSKIPMYNTCVSYISSIYEFCVVR